MKVAKGTKNPAKPPLVPPSFMWSNLHSTCAPSPPPPSPITIQHHCKAPAKECARCLPKLEGLLADANWETPAALAPQSRGWFTHLTHYLPILLFFVEMAVEWQQSLWQLYRWKWWAKHSIAFDHPAPLASLARPWPKDPPCPCTSASFITSLPGFWTYSPQYPTSWHVKV